MAEAYATMGYNELLPPREAMPKAKAAVLKSLELDDTQAGAYAVLGDIVSTYEWDCR